MQTDAMHGLVLENPKVPKTRIDGLVEFVDLCTSAKVVAEAIGDTFLVYMLAMTIQAAQTEMRPNRLALRR